MGEPRTLREALDRDLIGMIRTSWPMDRSAEEKGWNEAVHACREKVRAALTERPRLVASPDSLRLDPEDPESVERLARAINRGDATGLDDRDEWWASPRELAAAIAREWKTSALPDPEVTNRG